MSDNNVSKQNAHLGFIGLGLMGSRFFRRLHSEGWEIQGWNRSKDVSAPLKNDGLAIAVSLGDVVRSSEVLLSSLRNDDAVRAVYLGQDGVFANVRPETIILEMSTTSPEVSGLLHDEAAKRRVHLIDLPVSGSTPAVEAGTVTLLGGGEQETFDRCTPIFESIAKQWYLMGPATAGIRMKLVVNLLLGVNMEAIAEAVSLGEHLKLDRNLLLDVLSKTAVIAPAFVGKLPKIKAGDYSPQFPLYLMSKDMDLVHSAATKAGAELPAASATRTVLKDASANAGDLDLSAVAPYVLGLAETK
jgi:3-hydroxyisobutyrate dehydrogenase-like beta-hydroxyacid dehydrogenase